MSDQDRVDIGPLTKFHFNVEMAQAAAEDLDLQIEALDERIDRIIKAAEIQVHGHPFPIITHILGLSRDQDELRLLGLALQKLSPLLPQLDELKKRRAVVDLAQENVHWLASTFGDFSSDVANDVARMLDHEGPESP